MGCAVALDESCLHILTDLRLLCVRLHGLQLLWQVSMRDVQGVQLISDTKTLLLTLAPAASSAGISMSAVTALEVNVRAV
eukprot:1435465-Prymnesium_polylepis.1